MLMPHRSNARSTYPQNFLKKTLVTPLPQEYATVPDTKRPVKQRLLFLPVTPEGAHMKFSVILPIPALLSISLTAIAVAALAQSPSTPPPSVISASYGKLPLSFEANQGQADPSIEFLSRGNGYSLFLTDSAAVLALGHAPACGSGISKTPTKSATCATSGSPRPDVVRMTLAGASKTSHAKAFGEVELPGKVNYLLGNDPLKWRTGLPTYAGNQQQHLSRHRPGLLRQPTPTRIRLRPLPRNEPGAHPAQIHGPKAAENRRKWGLDSRRQSRPSLLPQAHRLPGEIRPS